MAQYGRCANLARERRDQATHRESSARSATRWYAAPVDGNGIPRPASQTHIAHQRGGVI